MHHAVGNVTADGDEYIYIGKPKKASGWVEDNKFISNIFLVTMGFRRANGTTYCRRFMQPITDTFTPGGKRP